MAMQVPLWLYFPQKNQALQVIQLPHPLDGFNGRYVLVGYLAHNHCQISPLYGPECEMVLAISLGFSNISLPIVGILAVPQGSGDTGFHTVYERQLGDGNFLRVVVTEFCWPDASGRPSELNALDHTIQFHEALFPYGFPPPAPLATIEVAPISHTLQLFAPAMIDTPIDNVYRKAINRALNRSPWKQLLFMTKAIYVGSYWVGLQNPFDFLEKLLEALENDKHLLSNCFVMAVEMNHMTLQELHEHPGFSGTKKDDQDAKVAYFFQLLSSDDRDEVQNWKPHKFTSWLIAIQYQVQQAILEIVQLHMFTELVWVSVGQHSNGLAEGNSQGRIADLFPEEIQGRDGLLGSGLVATLLTVIYHMLHIWLPDKTPGRKLSAMNRIIMASLGKLYANEYQFPQFHEMMRKLPFITITNVLPIDPKTLEPKVSVNDNRLRNMSNILPIMMYATDSTRPGLPNTVFTSIHSEKAMQEVDVSCFQGGP
ncbi:hypothetical protein DFH29DRAFT_873566 [Suillus ampliporus]|nr:hypothetical protein DFH29DRAFT_873566 [Suillus ampliporus]